MSQNHEYNSVALCALVNSGKIRVPLSRTRALHVIARLEGVAGWRAIAGSERSDELKERAVILRAAVNERVVDGRLSTTAAQECVERLKPRVPRVVSQTQTEQQPKRSESRTSTKRRSVVWDAAHPTTLTSESRKPKGFPTDRTEATLREYLKKYQFLHAQTAFDIIMADMRERATTHIPDFDDQIEIHPRIAAVLGKRFYHRGKRRLHQNPPSSGYYPPWHLLHALSVFFDVTLDAGPAEYGYMVLKTRESVPRFLRYEIKGYDWAHEDQYFQRRMIR